ncbi:MAG: glycoside hydrolase family 5 protein [Prevotella sp.]|nr:glycoside hydrolase family 5 protein [Prevotella sp.]
MIRKLVCTAFMAVTLTTVNAQTGFDKSVDQMIVEMAPGWNLGNTMEAGNNANNFTNKGGLGAETSWQQTKTTQELIDYVKSMGFKSVRIPCAWVMGHLSNATEYTIDVNWMNRVKEIVDYCIKDGLYVIINDHWDGGWLENHIADTNTSTINKNKTILRTLWTQIANAFKDYDEHLLFAGLNEPNADNQAATNNLIQYEQVFIDAVRATGGNNARRVLIIQGPTTNIDHTCNFMKNNMPQDTVEKRLMIEVHYYDPWQFWGMEKDESWGKVFYYWGKDNHLSGSSHNATWGEEDYMESQLKKMKTNFVDKGIPVIIGEFGANWRNISTVSGESQEKHNASIKAHYRELHRLCKELGGMAPYVWDINVSNQNGTKGVMTLINRKNLSIYGTHAMEGVNEIYPKPDPTHITTFLPDDQPNLTSAVYNLQGMKVSDVSDSYNLPCGIYVVSGRKVVLQ